MPQWGQTFWPSPAHAKRARPIEWGKRTPRDYLPKSRRVSRRATIIVAVLLMLMGSIWFLQGIGLLGGSAMTGTSFWAWVGGSCILAAVVLLARLGRRSP